MSTNNMDDVELPLSKANGGTGLIVSSTLVQVVTTVINPANTTAVTPFTSSAIAITDGSQIATLSITPTNTSSVLDIYASINLNNNSAQNGSAVMSLHRDGGNGIAASAYGFSSNNTGQALYMRKRVVSGSLSSTTFTLRIGSQTGITISCNSYNSANVYGGVGLNYFIIKEYLP